MSRLEKVWIDDNLNSQRWNEFLCDKRKEWEKTITPVSHSRPSLAGTDAHVQATVLLSANVGLLAIQSVDNQQGAANRSVAQIASYASVIMSLASYLIGHILSLQHSRELRDNDGNAVRTALSLGSSGQLELGLLDSSTWSI